MLCSSDRRRSICGGRDDVIEMLRHHWSPSSRRPLPRNCVVLLFGCAGRAAQASPRRIESARLRETRAGHRTDRASLVDKGAVVARRTPGGSVRVVLSARELARFKHQNEPR
jgi:hypothetical protein